MRLNVRAYVHCLSAYANTATEKLIVRYIHILEGFMQAGEEVYFALRPINLLT